MPTSNLQAWGNRKTRSIEGAVCVSEYEFKSHRLHQIRCLKIQIIFETASIYWRHHGYLSVLQKRIF